MHHHVAERLRRWKKGALLGAFVMLVAACGPAQEAAGPGEGATDAGGGAATGADTAADGDTAAGSDTAVPQGDVTLDYSWWGGDTRNRLQQEVVDLFEEQNPNITLQTQTADFPAHWERLAVQSAAEDQPDVFQMQTRYLAEFGTRGALAPLDPYVEDGTIDVSGIPDAVLESGRLNGELLMLGTSFSYRGIYYDAAAFEEAGVEPFTNATTWEELADTAIQLAESDLPDGVWPSLDFCEDDNSFYAYLRGHGVQPFEGQALGFEQEHLIDWFTYWQDLRQAGAVPPIALQVEQQGDAFEDTMFARANVLIDALSTNKFETMQELVPGIEVTGLPNGPEGPGDSLVVSGHSISPHTPNADAAAQFIDFFVNNIEAASIYKADNGIPSADPAADAAAEALGGGRQFELFREIEEDFKPLEPLPEGSSAVMQDALPRFCHEVAFDRLSLEEAADQFFREAQDALG